MGKDSIDNASPRVEKYSDFKSGLTTLGKTAMKPDQGTLA
jgi:hypothetical protein